MLKFRGLGFTVLGFRNLALRVLGLGFRAWGSRFKTPFEGPYSCFSGTVE